MNLYIFKIWVIVNKNKHWTKLKIIDENLKITYNSIVRIWGNKL